MKKYILLLSSLVIALGFCHDVLAKEDATKVEVYGGALSYHFETDKHLNNINPLLIGSYDDWATGYFYNSYKNQSFMAGKNFYTSPEGSDVTIGVIVGVVSGYTKRQVPMCFTDEVCPLAMPYIQWEYDNWKPTIVFGGMFASAMLGYEF